MVLKRNCAVCGKSLEIIVKKNEKTGENKYSGGHYIGRVKLPFGEGQYIKTKEKIFEEKRYVYRWTGKEKKIEYWECNSCYKK